MGDTVQEDKLDVDVKKRDSDTTENDGRRRDRNVDDRGRDRNRDRDGDRDRDRRDRDRDLDRDRDRDRQGRDRDADRGRDRDRDMDRDRRDRNTRDRDGDRRRDNDRDRNRDIDRNKDAYEEQKRKEDKEIVKRSEEKKENKIQEAVQKERATGVYIPPFKLAMMMKDITDKSSPEYQRMTWDALRKSINGLINKVSISNISNIVVELFRENIVRGRGLFARSLMKAQHASPTFTNVYAALVAVVNTKMPENGELLLKRLVEQFKRAFRRNDKAVLLSSTRFIAHLVNQQVCGQLLPLELATLLLDKPTDDSVEVAVEFIKECGYVLQDISPKGVNSIFERFRGILHEGEIDKRVQYMIENLFAIRKSNFAEYPGLVKELDIVDYADQIPHEGISLDDTHDVGENLNYFREDPDFVEHEAQFEEIKKTIVGESDSEGDAEGEGGSEEGSDSEGEGEAAAAAQQQQGGMAISDATETALVNLRRTIYLTIMSSVDVEDCTHKLLKIQIQPGHEIEICTMLIECCSQERTFLRLYGLTAQRLCMLNKLYQELFDGCFAQQYSMIHRLETNKLRNVAKFFAHLLHSDSLPWSVFEYIHLNEEETTSSSRIFIKILLQEVSEYLGLQKLNAKFKDPFMASHYEGLFPKDNPKNTRFAINFFTSIGLGGLTDDLREWLRNAPKMIMQQKQVVESSSDSSSSDSSDSDSSDSDSSSSDSSSSSSSSSSASSRGASRRRRRSPPARSSGDERSKRYRR